MGEGNGYRFRLTFFHRTPGLLDTDDQLVQFDLTEQRQAVLFARDAKALSGAKKFHIECGGYESETAAREAANSLRLRLRIFNCILGLGLIVPLDDQVQLSWAEGQKKKYAERGLTLHDSVAGILVIPEDCAHVEHIVSGEALVGKGGTSYFLDGIKKLWPLDLTFDQSTEDALEILCAATSETSDRAKFLLTYLSLEELIIRPPKNDMVRSILSSFQDQLSNSALEERDVDSLRTGLENLKKQSFQQALISIIENSDFLNEINGIKTIDFVRKCVRVRNKMAHTGTTMESENLNDLSSGLRTLIIHFVWAKHRIPSVTFDFPSSSIAMKPFFEQVI